MRSTADSNMLLFRRHWIIFSKPKPYILLDTALLNNYISRPRMMTWLRENWRLYHIRCEIRSEINGIGNVASSWVSSWDSWLLLSYLSLILRVFLLAKIVRLVMHNNREFKQRRRRRFINGKKKKNRETECDCSLTLSSRSSLYTSSMSFPGWCSPRGNG